MKDGGRPQWCWDATGREWTNARVRCSSCERKVKQSVTSATRVTIRPTPITMIYVQHTASWLCGPRCRRLKAFSRGHLKHTLQNSQLPGRHPWIHQGERMTSKGIVLHHSQTPYVVNPRLLCRSTCGVVFVVALSSDFIHARFFVSR